MYRGDLDAPANRHDELSFAANWFPLTWASHMLDYELYGADLGRFHTTSLGLHIANTLLLFALLVRLTGCNGLLCVATAVLSSELLSSARLNTLPVTSLGR